MGQPSEGLVPKIIDEVTRELPAAELPETTRRLARSVEDMGQETGLEVTIVVEGRERGTKTPQAPKKADITRGIDPLEDGIAAGRAKINNGRLRASDVEVVDDDEWLERGIMKGRALLGANNE